MKWKIPGGTPQEAAMQVEMEEAEEAEAAAAPADPWIHGSIFFILKHIFYNQMKSNRI